MGCKFKFFWWHLPTIIRASMFVTTCTTGFYAVVFPNYELNLVSTKKWFSLLINGLAIEMDYHDFKRSLPLRFVTLTTGWFSCCCPRGLDLARLRLGELTGDTILEGSRNWLSLSHIICAVFYLRQTLLRNYESCATKCRAFSFQLQANPLPPPPPTNRLVTVLPSLPLAVNNMTCDKSSWYCSLIFIK